jgi:MOSC domain-containing protein YiiM
LGHLVSRVISLNIGRARRFEAADGAEQWSGIDKRPLSGRCKLGLLGFEGDERVDPRRHGPENHAVYAYPAEHYGFWQRYLGRGPFSYGFIGENLTLSGPLETQVRLGDVLRIGEATLQVVQPRIPCRKLSVRMGGSFAGTFLRSRKVGYYLRVVERGDVSAGDEVVVIESDERAPSLDDFVRVTQLDYAQQPELERLLGAKALLPTWRSVIEEKLVRARSASPTFGSLELAVESTRSEGQGARSYRLVSARGQHLPPFRAGEALPVFALDEAGARLGVWPCLLEGDPCEPSCYSLTLRDVVSREPPPLGQWASSLPFALKPGTRLLTTAPRGDFTLDGLGPASELVFWCEGVSLAPVLSLLHEAVAYHRWQRLRVVHLDRAGGSQGLRSRADALQNEHASLRLELRGTLPDSGWSLPALEAEVMLVGSPEFVERARQRLGARRVTLARVDHS